MVCAEKAIKLHISEKHGFVFNNLLSTEKSQTGFTETQKEFLKYYYAGIPDKGIAVQMDISTSTVRFQRYSFKEKVKQAKMILALNELLNEKNDERKNININENDTDEKFELFFDSLTPLILKTFQVKEKNKLYILKIIAQKFEREKIYTEKEVNEILKQIYDDHVSVRRSLIDYGLMSRTDDGKEYWVT